MEIILVLLELVELEVVVQVEHYQVQIQQQEQLILVVEEEVVQMMVLMVVLEEKELLY